MRLRLAIASVFVMALAVIGSAGAITGNPVPTGDKYNYVVNLAFYDESGAYLWRCSGTMLSSTVVLTAGHCTFGADSATLWATRGRSRTGTTRSTRSTADRRARATRAIPVPALTQRERRTRIPVTTTTPTFRTPVMRASSFSTSRSHGIPTDSSRSQGSSMHSPLGGDTRTGRLPWSGTACSR